VKVSTHLSISSKWVGEALEVADGRSVARLQTLPEMAADERGLVHGGFTFGLADYAAMLAVNDPYVVLGAAETRFLAPVRVGEVLVARAGVLEEKGKKRTVTCSVFSGDAEVFTATFTCFVLDRHILEQ